MPNGMMCQLFQWRSTLLARRLERWECSVAFLDPTGSHGIRSGGHFFAEEAECLGLTFRDSHLSPMRPCIVPCLDQYCGWCHGGFGNFMQTMLGTFICSFGLQKEQKVTTSFNFHWYEMTWNILVWGEMRWDTIFCRVCLWPTKLMHVYSW